MSKTQWYPFPVHKPRSWLLGNGEIVTEPTLEQSGSGKKLRIAGTTTSAFTKDMHTMILAAVDETAKAKNTYVWTPLHEREEKMRAKLGIEPGKNLSDLYLLRPGATPGSKGNTQLWWTFAHPEFPSIEAMLVLDVSAHGAGHAVQVKLGMPDTRITSLMETEPVVEADESMSLAWYYQFQYPQDHNIREFAVTNPPGWSDGVLGTTHWQTDRQVVQHLLRLVDKIDGLAEILVHDMRDWDDLKWMRLEPTRSNYTGSFRQDLTDYLSGVSAVERAVQIYDDLRDALRSLGISMGPLTENDFQRALMEGEKEALRLDIAPIAGEDQHVHGLGVHLASGTFTVTCPVRHATPDEVTGEWEKAKIIASLTGEEDELLAYAREYGRTHDEKRARKVMRERMKGARED